MDSHHCLDAVTGGVMLRNHAQSFVGFPFPRFLAILGVAVSIAGMMPPLRILSHDPYAGLIIEAPQGAGVGLPPGPSHR